MENIAPVAGTLSTYGLYAVCAILLIAVVYLFKTVNNVAVFIIHVMNKHIVPFIFEFEFNVYIFTFLLDCKFAVRILCQSSLNHITAAQKTYTHRPAVRRFYNGRSLIGTLKIS